MGEVYKARDTRLDRTVAIKILPEAFAADPDRVARFQREAKTLAALNHPNIAQIFGLEQAGDVHALAMELVAGEDLSERIARGPIPIDEALPIAKQIAEALEAAHEQGIIHRDLKPANIRMTPDGRVKVLDFGLAKAIDSAAGSSSSVSMSPTITSPAMTQAGMILGTAAYMAPEQAKGRAVDKRSDIWAFGCVLYEMLAGRRAFGGDDVTDTLAAVVLREPDLNTLPSGTPAVIRKLLERCLRKDPKRRLHDIADARLDLDEPVSDATPAAGVPVARRSRGWFILGGAVSLLLGGIAVLQTVRLARASNADVIPMPVRFSLSPPDGADIPAFNNEAAAMSPDGSRIVFHYRRGSVAQLFMRRLDEGDAKPVAGTEGGFNPFFSSDGKWIGFSDGGKLKKVFADGGAVVAVGDIDFPFGAGAWTPDDTIVYTPNYASGLWKVSASGGIPQKLTDPKTADGELGHFWPQILPDGKTVLFTSFRTPAERSRIELYSLDTGQRRVVIDGGFFGRYAPSGHVLFARATTVFAAAFDPRRPETVGQPVPVLSGVGVSLQDGLAHFSVSMTGTLAYVSQAALNAPRQLAWIDRTGRTFPINDMRRGFDFPRLSPDGRRVALTIREEGDVDVWVYDLLRENFGRITALPGTQSRPVWSADGRRLFFNWEEPVFHIYSRAADGAEAPQRVVDGPFDVNPTSVSPDGRFLVYERSDPVTKGGIWLLPLTGDAKPKAFVDTPAQEQDAAVSPDGRRLAYESNETGRGEIYLQAFPDGGDRVQVSTSGGRNARWSRDGKELYFREGDKMMAVSLQGSAVGRPMALFEKRFEGTTLPPMGVLSPPFATKRRRRHRSIWS